MTELKELIVLAHLSDGTLRQVMLNKSEQEVVKRIVAELHDNELKVGSKELVLTYGQSKTTTMKERFEDVAKGLGCDILIYCYEWKDGWHFYRVVVKTGKNKFKYMKHINDIIEGGADYKENMVIEFSNLLNQFLA